jgi:AraC-like DNA-binding protein
MVCGRCIKAVSGILKEIDIPYENILLGEVMLAGELSSEKKEKLKSKLSEEGFELIDDRKSIIISQVKKYILEYVRNLDYNGEKIHLSDFLSERLSIDSSYLSNLFSSVEGQTIENYFIAQKIERAKELLVYDELNLSEIAFKLGYSSTAHLSNQFKKVTGLTPTHFKSIGAKKRLPLDQV